MRPKLKKSQVIVTIVIALLLILFLPIPKGTLDDGGTRVYAARLYKIVAWNRVIAIEEEGAPFVSTRYQKTSVYWFAESQKSIDELWESEFEKNKDKIVFN